MRWISEPVNYKEQVDPLACWIDCDLCFKYHCSKGYA